MPVQSASVRNFIGSPVTEFLSPGAVAVAQSLQHEVTQKRASRLMSLRATLLLAIRAILRCSSLLRNPSAPGHVRSHRVSGAEIHRRSQRKQGPLVRVNCASIPRELFESELFGHVRGSFTGAITETVAATERFDIVLPVMDYGQFSPFFWRWFNWWDDYFKQLTPWQVHEIERLGRKRESTVENYRPRDHWLSYRHTPAFMPEMT